MTDEKELGRALKEEQDTIVVEADLAKKVIKIKATGTVAWGVCITALGVAVVAVLSAPVTAPVSIPTALTLSVPAMTILGPGAATAAVSIAVAAGGVGVLNKLRDYRMEKISSNKVILHRR